MDSDSLNLANQDAEVNPGIAPDSLFLRPSGEQVPARTIFATKDCGPFVTKDGIAEIMDWQRRERTCKIARIYNKFGILECEDIARILTKRGPVRIKDLRIVDTVHTPFPKMSDYQRSAALGIMFGGGKIAEVKFANSNIKSALFCKCKTSEEYQFKRYVFSNFCRDVPENEKLDFITAPQPGIEQDFPYDSYRKSIGFPKYKEGLMNDIFFAFLSMQAGGHEDDAFVIEMPSAPLNAIQDIIDDWSEICEFELIKLGRRTLAFVGPAKNALFDMVKRHIPSGLVSGIPAYDFIHPEQGESREICMSGVIGIERMPVSPKTVYWFDIKNPVVGTFIMG